MQYRACRKLERRARRPAKNGAAVVVREAVRRPAACRGIEWYVHRRIQSHEAQPLPCIRAVDIIIPSLVPVCETAIALRQNRGTEHNHDPKPHPDTAPYQDVSVKCKALT